MRVHRIQFLTSQTANMNLFQQNMFWVNLLFLYKNHNKAAFTFLNKIKP